MDAQTEKRIDVDVLVIGGGFAGTWAALRAAQKHRSVVLVDKAHVGRSGASTVSGGVTTAPTTRDDLEEWVRELSVFGHYAADQDATRVLLHDQIERLHDLEGWNVPIVKDERGAPRRIRTRGMVHVRALEFSPRHAIERLRLETLLAGAQILDRVEIVELLTSDGLHPTSGRVVGAAGFDVQTGEVLVLHAKTVIMATGLLAIKGFHPVDNCTGDGFAMGYRVGARFLDAEFAAGGTFEFAWGTLWMGGYNVAIGHGARLINGLGERFMERYDPERMERTENNRVIAAFLKEVQEGRGPVCLDLTGMDERYWDALRRSRAGRRSVLLSDAIPDPRRHPVPVEAAWTIWNGGKGGFHIDLWSRTTVPGLYAAGAVAMNSAVGRHGSAGAPTAMAMVSGARAGIAAAEEAEVTDLVLAPEESIREIVERMRGSVGGDRPGDVDTMHRQIRDLLGSSEDMMVMDATRIERALEQIEALRAEWASVRAVDLHGLVKYFEAYNVLDSLELVFHSMSDRTESRESFYRSDFPLTDDENWLCWHTATRRPHGIEFERRSIPFDRYVYKPPPPQITVSPLAAIMRGDFEPVGARSRTAADFQ